MTRFQLVFKYPEGDVTEMRDNNADGEPHIDGTLVIDGQTYLIKGVEWLVKSDDIGDSNATLRLHARRPSEGIPNLSRNHARPVERKWWSRSWHRLEHGFASRRDAWNRLPHTTRACGAGRPSRREALHSGHAKGAASSATDGSDPGAGFAERGGPAA